jgi:hypothetical protein
LRPEEEIRKRSAFTRSMLQPLNFTLLWYIPLFTYLI